MKVQNWIKRGLLFEIGQPHLIKSYAAVPNGFWITKHILRILFSSRNSANQSIPYFVDYDFKSKTVLNPPSLINLPIGNIGTFDDSGIMPICTIYNNNEIWLYYQGWNLGVTVPFRNSIGIAVSTDNAFTFKKMFEGPILDRTKEEPYFVGTGHVILDEGIYKMWYLSCTKWDSIDDKLVHFYHIKYATSIDGINWQRTGRVAIDFLYENEYAISVPRVIKENGMYKMWYSYRGGLKSENYRIGYAESIDGLEWIRKDSLIILETSNGSWDSEMLCYPFIINYEGNRYMLYNGNDYGKTGFGLAILEE